MFCPKCGAILLPKKQNNKRVLGCSCGFVDKNLEKAEIKETIIDREKKVEVVDREKGGVLPMTTAECPKCGHNKAYYWLVQTRAGDEPETKFLKCVKCNHTWRDYN